jgi:hypothetical protein
MYLTEYVVELSIAVVSERSVEKSHVKVTRGASFSGFHVL